MRKRILLSALAALVLVGSPVVLSAQQGHAVERGEMERAMTEADASDDARRAAIRSVLERDEVRWTAEARGIDLVRAEDAVSTLDGGPLARVYEQALRVDEALAGGDTTLVISATTLIIALLVLIIILVVD